jgi:L-fucose mutarotase
MLRGIPKILSPELLKVLCEMGHSDRLVIGDGNFPAQSIGRDSIVIRCDGHSAAELLEAILPLFPLDGVPQPAAVMAVPQGAEEPAIWRQFASILEKNEGRGDEAIRRVERFAFYEEARQAYAVVATGESAPFGNIIIQKGVIL